MEKFKKIAAILGVVVLLVVFALPMVFALCTGEDAAGWFRASIGAVILVPVMAYAFLLVFRVLNGKKKEPEGKISNVVFDVGNVLMEYNWKTYLQSFHFPEEEYKKLSRVIFQSREWEERDRGLLTEEEYVEHFVAAAPEYEADVREVMRRTPETIHPLDYAVPWVRFLKDRGYGVYIISNYSDYMLERTKEEMKFLEYVDGAIFSCEVRQKKPEREIYETLLGQYGLSAKSCVFLDDRAENCEGARRAGMQAIVFENMKQAAAELEKLGVK